MADRTHRGAPDALLFGAAGVERLVAVEHLPSRDGHDEVALFFREEDRLREAREPFEPFVIGTAEALEGCPGTTRTEELAGPGPLNRLAFFPSWKAYGSARTWLKDRTGVSPGNPTAPTVCLNDPVQQYLMGSGRTHFLGLPFEALRRLQLDIECLTTEGYDFCNADREGDAIVAIALADSTGWVEVLSAAPADEKGLLERFVERVRDRDPDVIEGHNIFNFDLPYLAARAKRHKVKLRLGRDGSAPSVRPSQFSAAERTLAYQRFDVFGRHVADTLFMVHAYDVSHRSLDGFGLKEVAVHFGLAAKDRTYIDGAAITREYGRDPDRVLRYVQDDVTETRALSSLLSRSHFVQAQMLPMSYQNVCVRGAATRIDALMTREYIRARHGLPLPGASHDFEGGYTDMFVEGVVRNVHHCDVRSLYPSLMLTRRIAPRQDDLGVFLRLLERLRAFRMDAKDRMQASGSDAERAHFDALQSTFKILINSFYGYLGFGQSRFADFDAAEKVTADGRALLRSMIEWIRKRGGTPIEIDTDGIYFVPPDFRRAADGEAFRREFQRSLPEGIDVEFDGEYASMYSYKMKNYALLSADGEVVIKGAALKSRGLEPFQRSFLRELVRLKLEGRDRDLPALKSRYVKAIRGREWPIEELAKTEILQDSPAAYAQKVAASRRSRSAAYELALASPREYRAGDAVAYYVTGERKNVKVFEQARLVSDWNPEQRDENAAYYEAKLDALYAKFVEESDQGELDFGG